MTPEDAMKQTIDTTGLARLCTFPKSPAGPGHPYGWYLSIIRAGHLPQYVKELLITADPTVAEYLAYHDEPINLGWARMVPPPEPAPIDPHKRIEGEIPTQ